MSAETCTCGHDWTDHTEGHGSCLERDRSLSCDCTRFVATTPTPFPTCAACQHPEHHLPCANDVVTHKLGGVRTDPCGCRGVWGDAA